MGITHTPPPSPPLSHILLVCCCRFDLQKSQSRVDRLEVRLADTLDELQKRPTLSSSSPNETSGAASIGDKGQEGVGGVAEGGVLNTGKEDKVTSEEVHVHRSVLRS